MKITRAQLQTLMDLIDITTKQELNCEEFLARLPAYLERLRVEPLTVRGHEPLILHLKICPECLEEFEALVEAMHGGLL